jgi:hypothetical protein
MTEDYSWISVNSSTLDKMRYDTNSRILTAVFNSSDVYEYYGVPYEEYVKVLEGKHPCSTSGSTPYGKFWKGKYPSIGSAFDYYIKKGGYEFRRIR